MGISGERVLVTGGAGFIGSELVRQLIAAGHQVTVVDNLINGKQENLQFDAADQLNLHIADIRDLEYVASILQKTDRVFHLACLGVRHSIHSPVENHEVNATATLHLLDLAKKAGVGRFVYVSSSEVYGTARTVPMTEEHPTFPMTVYGSSKLAGECYTRAYYTTYGYPTVVVRPFNSYGPRSHHEGDSGEVIPKFLLRSLAGQPMVIFGDGLQTRDFTYVSDSARAIMLAGFSDAAIGETINLGSGKEITVKDLAIRIQQIVNTPEASVIHETPRPGDVLRLFADTTRAETLLGFKAQFSLTEGLQALKTWYETLDQSPETLLQSEIVRNWEPL